MVLGAYRGSVECRGTFEPIETCASIIDDIDTTQITKTFGLRSDPTTDIPLPVTLKASTYFVSRRPLHYSETYSCRWVCRGRQECRSRLRQAGHDVLVSDLGGRDAGLFGLCEGREGRGCEGFRYVVWLFYVDGAHVLRR